MVTWWRQYYQVWLVIVGVKVGLFGLSILAFALRNELATDLSVWAWWGEVWSRWDALSYIAVARDGYQVAGIERTYIVFFPLYPGLIRVMKVIVGDWTGAAMIVSNGAAMLGLYWFYRLAEMEFGKKAAFRSLVALLIFPTAYFFNASYTEGLFLWLSVGSFLAARRGKWGWAGLAGGLAALTRMMGVLLWPALVWEFWQMHRHQKNRWVEGLWLMLIPGMFVIYLLINYDLFGTPWFWMEMQKVNWYRELAWPWVGFKGAWDKIGGWPYGSYQVMFGWMEVGASLLAIAASAWAWWKLRWSYAIYLTLVTIQIMSSSFMYSNPRFLLSMWPVFFMLGYLGRYRAAAIVWMFWSAGILVVLAGQFTRGWWAF